MPVRPAGAVRPREVLAVVDGEVEVVQRVVRGAVDDMFKPVPGNHIGIVDLNVISTGYEQIKSDSRIYSKS